MSELRLTVNGGEHVLDAPVGTSLAQVLREELGLTGTKVACNEGHCVSGSSSMTSHTSSKRPSTSFSVRISLAN